MLAGDDVRTDYYDNSIEVWGVMDIDLDVAAAKLKESGFSRVWLHQHVGRGYCRCPLRPVVEAPKNQCMGCQADWPLTGSFDNYHREPNGGLVGCIKSIKSRYL